MPLVIAPINIMLKVIKILASEKVKKHLENLGITKGSSLELLNNDGGNVILLVKGSRLALDKDLALKIVVV